jgi:DNA-binding NtrC family response regulator
MLGSDYGTVFALYKDVMKRILIVDDEPDILAALSWVLNSKYKVVTERDSKKIIKLIEKGNFDLLITDLSMPNVDGWELVQLIHKIRPGLPIVAMSVCFDEVEKIKNNNGKGISAYLQKPFENEEVEKLVEKLLEEKSSEVER